MSRTGEDRSRRAAALARAAAITAALLIAGCSYLDSAVALIHLARETGAMDGRLAWTLPLILDGVTTAGLLMVISRTIDRDPTWGPWLMVLAGTAASVAGNVAHAPEALTAQVVAAAPPLALAVILEALRAEYRRLATKAEPEPDPEPDEGPVAVPEAVPVLEGQAVPVAVPEPKPVPADPRGTGAREVAERLWATSGGQVGGAELARAAGCSDGYARRLLREFRDRDAQPAHTNGHRP